MSVRFMGHDHRVSDLIAQAVQRLHAGGVQLDPGLSDEEVSRIQDRFGFVLGPEHRELLQSSVPVGERWPDWRNGSDEDLAGQLAWPVEGLLFDVHNNGFWPASWGGRPDSRDARERGAREHLAHVPRLVPLYSHRYLAADPKFSPSPVFSVHQADVIYYGDDLLDYVAREFGVAALHPSTRRTHVPFWSDLAQGAENGDL
jgi:hypothetical protein